jgi:hypothetical protein
MLGTGRLIAGPCFASSGQQNRIWQRLYSARYAATACARKMPAPRSAVRRCFMRERRADQRPLISGSQVRALVRRNPQLIARKQKGRFFGHFSGVVVSDFRSLPETSSSGPFLTRLSPAAKIPFQTRRGKKVREGSARTVRAAERASVLW